MPSLKGPILVLVAASTLTWRAYTTAQQIQSGAYEEVTGRRALFMRPLAWIAGTLGPTGVLVVAGLVTAGLVAWLVLTIKKRKAAEKP